MVTDCALFSFLLDFFLLSFLSSLFSFQLYLFPNFCYFFVYFVSSLFACFFSFWIVSFLLHYLPLLLFCCLSKIFCDDSGSLPSHHITAYDITSTCYNLTLSYITLFHLIVGVASQIDELGLSVLIKSCDRLGDAEWAVTILKEAIKAVSVLHTI